MDPSMIKTFIYACVAVLASITGVLLMGWAAFIMRNMSKLATSVENLTGLVSKLQEEQKLADLRTEHVRETLEELKSKACTRDSCPFKEAYLYIRKTDQITIDEAAMQPGIHIRGSGAKRIEKLIRLMQDHKDSLGLLPGE